MSAARYVVHGRVQGVGFRWFVRKAAMSLGVRGAVRNLRDGTVEIIAAGTPDALAALERSLRTGPSGARVTDVVVGPATPPEEPGFEIR